MASQASMRQAAKDIAALADRLHILLNSAGNRN
jgi:NAD(P)-dependent dehydrogenase (short-subunit alcohol dehydrogenase family)